MAITTVAGIASGRYYTRDEHYGSGGAWSPNGRDVEHMWMQLNALPVAKALGTPGVNGATLDGTVDTTKCIPFANPPSGQAYLSDFIVNAGPGQGITSPNAVGVWLVDALWYNTGLSVTTTTAQSFTTTLPSRDANGGTTGVGVQAGLLCTTSTTNPLTGMTISYTDVNNGAGRTGTMAAWPANPIAGSMTPFELQAGDTGVASIQSITLGASMLAGAISVILYRSLAHCNTARQLYRGRGARPADALTTGFPKLYNGSALWTFCHVDSGANTQLGNVQLGYTYG